MSAAPRRPRLTLLWRAVIAQVVCFIAPWLDWLILARFAEVTGGPASPRMHRVATGGSVVVHNSPGASR